MSMPSLSVVHARLQTAQVDRSHDRRRDARGRALSIRAGGDRRRGRRPRGLATCSRDLRPPLPLRPPGGTPGPLGSTPSQASKPPPGISCCCSTRASSIEPRNAALRRPNEIERRARPPDLVGAFRVQRRDSIWTLLERGSSPSCGGAADPQTIVTSFGLGEYDRYAKATTCFHGSARRCCSDANDRSSNSYYTDTRYASDDTSLIRILAARQPINVSPRFACIYAPHESYRAFMPDVFHRGRTFVDSYGPPRHPASSRWCSLSTPLSLLMAIARTASAAASSLAPQLAAPKPLSSPPPRRCVATAPPSCRSPGSAQTGWRRCAPTMERALWRCASRAPISSCVCRTLAVGSASDRRPVSPWVRVSHVGAFARPERASVSRRVSAVPIS